MALATKDETTQAPPTALAIRQDVLAKIGDVEEIIGAATPNALATMRDIERGLTLAKAIQELRKFLDANEDVMAGIVALQGSPLGFKTDKDSKPPNERYTAKELRDVVITAWLGGAHLTGNEFNVIAANCYFTKEFFERKVCEMPGLADFVDAYEPPEYKGDTRAFVKASASWTYFDEPDELTVTLAIRANKGSTDDAVLGKAKRKLIAAVVRRILLKNGGMMLPDGEIGDDPNTITDADYTVNGKPGAPPAGRRSMRQPPRSTAPQQPAPSSEAPKPEDKPAAQTSDPTESADDREATAPDAIADANELCGVEIDVDDLKGWEAFIRSGNAKVIETGTLANGHPFRTAKVTSGGKEMMAVYDDTRGMICAFSTLPEERGEERPGPQKVETAAAEDFDYYVATA